MNTLQRFLIATGFIILSALVSIVAAPDLPNQMVTHWNVAGEPDATMSKAVTLVLFPAITAGLVALLAIVPRIDPRRENIAAFRPTHDWFVILITALMFVIHVGVVAFNLGYVFDFTLLVLAAVAGLFYYIGVVLECTERNWFVGIRTPWTLESDEVWQRTHHLGGRLFKLTALVALIGLAFDEYAIYFFLVPALGTGISTIVYSYYLYEKLEREG
jgi:uncharacterized membrane protein